MISLYWKRYNQRRKVNNHYLIILEITFSDFLGITLNSNKTPTLDEKELFLDLLRYPPIFLPSFIFFHLRNGPRQFPFTRTQMKVILKRGKEAFKKDPSLLEVE